ncbi:MAG: hypothetical protein L0956_10750, partial [Candidatus Mariimomonas ferrooxydans]
MFYFFRKYKKYSFWFFLNFIVLIFGFAFIAANAYGLSAGSDKAPPEVIDAIADGRAQDIIVLFDDTDIENEASLLRRDMGITYDSEVILEIKAAGYDSLKQDVISVLPEGEFEILKDYSHLPMMFLKIESQYSLDRLLGHSGVVRVYVDEAHPHFLARLLHTTSTITH